MSYNAQTYETPTTISPEPAHQDKRSVVIPFEPTAPSHTSSVLDAIEQSGMPLPTQEARSKRPTPPQRRYREQARRLVDTRALDRTAWLSIRQSGIGSSDAAAAVGLHPYKSQLEL